MKYTAFAMGFILSAVPLATADETRADSTSVCTYVAEAAITKRYGSSAPTANTDFFFDYTVRNAVFDIDGDGETEELSTHSDRFEYATVNGEQLWDLVPGPTGRESQMSQEDSRLTEGYLRGPFFSVGWLPFRNKMYIVFSFREAGAPKGVWDVSDGFRKPACIFEEEDHFEPASLAIAHDLPEAFETAVMPDLSSKQNLCARVSAPHISVLKGMASNPGLIEATEPLTPNDIAWLTRLTENTNGVVDPSLSHSLLRNPPDRNVVFTMDWNNDGEEDRLIKADIVKSSLPICAGAHFELLPDTGETLVDLTERNLLLETQGVRSTEKPTLHYSCSSYANWRELEGYYFLETFEHSEPLSQDVKITFEEKSHQVCKGRFSRTLTAIYDRELGIYPDN